MNNQHHSKRKRRDSSVRYFHRGRICKGLHVEFSAPETRPGDILMMTCEWDPRLPETLSSKMRRNYERERGQFITLLEADGHAVLVFE